MSEIRAFCKNLIIPSIALWVLASHIWSDNLVQSSGCRWKFDVKHIEQIALQFVEKAYPGIDTPIVTNIQIVDEPFRCGVIIFNVKVSELLVYRPSVKVRVKAKIHIDSLEIPGSIEEWDGNERKTGRE